MKYALIGLVLSMSAMASVTPSEMREIRSEANGVMMDLGANPRLNPRVLSVRVTDELGSRAMVSFRYTEDQFGQKDCTFIYDLKAGATVSGSALCR